MRELWSNTCERTQSEQKEQVKDSSYPKGIEVLLKETAPKSFPDPENVDTPLIAPRDCECTTRLFSPSACSSLGASERRSLGLAHRSILALSYSL